MTITTTTYCLAGNDHVAIQIGWDDIAQLLGRDHDGSPEDDAAILAAMGDDAPEWAADAEGWMDDLGWGLIGPAVEDCPMINVTTRNHIREEAPDAPAKRRAECADCGTPGVHVDTTAGEIIQCGEVVATVSGETLLMVDERGALTCDECEED